MEMPHEKKLKFIHQMTKLGLDSIPHYDAGGVIGAVTQLPAVGLANSALGNPLGQIGNALNNNFTPTGATITPGTNAAQLGTAYTGAQGAVQQQNNLAGQVQPGVAQGLGAQNTLSGQLSAEAAGQGPNPAQAALNQSTGQNIAQQAALAAGQRGASSNAGLIASQNAQQGAATQQQAVGQAATLQAQQQIAAQQAQQQLAAQQVGQGQAAVQANNAAQQNEQSILQGANTAANQANVQQQSNLNTVGAQIGAGNQQVAGGILGGVLSGASSVLGGLGFAKGGEVPKMASGGYMAPTPLVVSNPYQANGPQSSVGQYLNSNGASSSMPAASSGSYQTPTAPNYNQAASNIGSMIGSAANSSSGYDGSGGSAQMIAGGPMDAGSVASDVMVAAKGGKVMKRPLPMMHGKNMALKSKGGKVKADGKSEKAVSNHDSYANDKVPAMLSEGEVVMDKDTLNDPGPIGQMARTVAHHINQRNAMGKRK